MKKITNDWLDSAESDLMLIRQIMSDENLTHLAAFHAQQAVEKSFKAIIEEFDLGNIKSHSLENLYNKISDKLKHDIVLETLIILDQLYIDSRYPGAFGLLPNGRPSISEVNDFYIFARNIFEASKSAV